MAGTAQPRLSDRLLGRRAGRYRGMVRAGEPGVAAGIALLPPAAVALVADGDRIGEGAKLAEVEGSAAELARIEDMILGELGVACGVATNAARVLAAAPEGLRVVCGGWKKLPAALKPAVRAGLAAAGLALRLLDDPFVYLDKNVVRTLGGVEAAVAAGVALVHGPVAVQIKDPRRAVEAVASGASAVMVDTGSPDDLAAAHAALSAAGARDRVTLAFGGGVRASDLVEVHAAGADVVDVGREVLRTPLLDLRFDVET